MTTEKDFQIQVLDLAKLYGWLCYHTYDSRRSVAGFPDLVLVHPERGLVFAELKSEKGRMTAAQREWVVAIKTAGGEVHVWCPCDWHFIETRLGPPL